MTDEFRWNLAIKNVMFWTWYAVENINEQIVLNKNHQILLKSEPLGVVGIITAAVPIDDLIFSVCAAIAYGNTVVLGIPTDRDTSVVAAEFENIFSSKPGLVSVIVNEEESLWKQFVKESAISSIWCVGRLSVPTEAQCWTKNILRIGSRSNLPILAKLFEVHATKSKSVWHPCL